MGLVTVSPAPYPEIPGALPGAGYTTLTLDASGDRVAFVFRAPKAGDLAKISFRLATVTSAQNLKVSFQDVDTATGFPDETDDQFKVVSSGITSNSEVKTGIISSDGTDTGTKRTVTLGQWVAVVVKFDSTAGNLDILSGVALLTSASAYVADNGGAGYVGRSIAPLFSVEYSDGSYAYLGDAWPHTKASDNALFDQVNYNIDSSPDERGLKFRLPFQCKISGAWIGADLDADADLILYDSDGSTVLATISLDKDIRGGTSPAYGLYRFSPVTLTANTYYRAVLKPTTATNISLFQLSVTTAAILDQLTGGQDFHLTTRADAGAWTDTTTTRPAIGLILDSLHDGSGGGESFTGQVLNRGIN